MATNGSCPTNRFHNRVRAIYWVDSPSFRRRGHILQRVLSIKIITNSQYVDTNLNTPTLLANTPNLNVAESLGAMERSSVKGRRGSRIVFSWTWKENKKKDIELFSSASSRTVCITDGTTPVLSWFFSLCHARIGAITEPRNPMKVNRVDSRMSVL